MKKGIFSLMMGFLLAFTGMANAQIETELLNEGFEGGTMPSGWSTTTYSSYKWSVGVGDDKTSTGAATGSYNAKCVISGVLSQEVYLVTPALDLADALSAKLTFNVVNRSYTGDTDEVVVCYRVGGGTWNQLYRTTAEHATWTPIEVELTGFNSDYQIGIGNRSHYGHGVGIDDVVVTAEIDPTAEPALAVNPDPIDMGARPNNCWMRPFVVELSNTGSSTSITGVDFNNNYFLPELGDLVIPFALGRNKSVEFTIATGNGEGNIDGILAVDYPNQRTAVLFNVSAFAYEPVCPDVWEMAYEINLDTTGFRHTPTNVALYDNYLLPPTTISDGKDAVYTLTVDHDITINASVTVVDGDKKAENAKMAIYTAESIEEVGGPDLTNYYDFATRNGNRGGNVLTYDFEDGTSQGWTAMDADGDGFNWYVTDIYGAHSESTFAVVSESYDNFYTSEALFPDNYFFSPQLTLGEGASMSFYASSFYGYPEHFGVFVSTTGTNPSDFALVQDYSEYSMDFTEQNVDLSNYAGQQVYIAFRHYDVTDQFAVIIDDITIDLGSVGPEPGKEYVINDMILVPGTYYIAASSTDDSWDVILDSNELPCPEAACNPIPADNADEVIPASVTLNWKLGKYTTEYRILFGTTYYCEDVLVDWTSDLAESYTIPYQLYNNTNYFWRVEERNGGCEQGVMSPVWGFTTTLNAPANLHATNENGVNIFEGETLNLAWDAIQDRTFRSYNVYQDNELIGSTSATEFDVEGLEYNMDGYTFTVTALYDEGESAPSNSLVVRVSGTGEVDGYVYEQDGTTGIANATATKTGRDEFGEKHTYTFTTDEDGHYHGLMMVGTYKGTASCEGYQDVAYEANPFEIVYGVTTDGVNYVMDEVFAPVTEVVAEYYTDPEDSDNQYVKVYWNSTVAESMIEDFETGDFSKFAWNQDSTYPFEITTTNPYEGTYCMQSSNFGVQSSTSSIDVTVEIPRDGMMSFYKRISSENGWDIGYFYIDGEQVATFTGESNWGMKEVAITEGVHNFKWAYKKDGSDMLATGEDRFFIDYIDFIHDAEPPIPGVTYDFDDGTMQGWTTIDADGDGYNWRMASSLMTGASGHNGSPDFVFSQSYDNETYSALNPDNYLVSPQVELGGIVKFYACAQDANYAAEHFGLAVSTTGNTSAADFTTIQEWTMTAKNFGGAPVGKKLAYNRSGRAQGEWYEYTVDLSAYSGMGYVAIRHFGSSDEFYLDVDDITIGEAGKSFNDRSLKYYNVYRTDCYNDGHTLENITLCGTEIYDTVFIDTQWPELASGVYKWGVTCVYEGNRGEMVETPITWVGEAKGEDVLEPRESSIVWSNCLEKDMYLDNAVDITVELNSADSPAGVSVKFTNLNAGEQELYPVAPVTLDATGYYAWESFRKGDYAIEITNGDAYEPIYDTVSILEATSLNYVMIENIDDVADLYVSHTGWAMWKGQNPIQPGETEFTEDFENGLGNWTMIDNDGDGNVWFHSSQSVTYSCYDYTGFGNNGTDGFAISQSYTDCDFSVYDADNFMVTSQKYSITSGSTLTFWADYANDDYPDHFSVCVATANNPSAADFTEVWAGNVKDGSNAKTDVRRVNNRLMNWRQHTIDLSAFAGQNVYIAFRHNDVDNYELFIDDVQLTAGAKNDRHIESYNVMCFTKDGEPIFSGSTENPFVQIDTEELVEGENYICKVAAIYTTGMSNYAEVEWQYLPCDNYAPATNVVANGQTISWNYPGGPVPVEGDTFEEGFEDGVLPAGWTTIDADGDGHNWALASVLMAGYMIPCHSGLDCVASESYCNDTYSALYPDNYLVSPQVNIGNNSTFSFWACAQDEDYASEHYGVAISTTTPTADAFTTIAEWTMTAKNAAGAGAYMSRDGKGTREGAWYQKTVDLSDYAGQKVYIAIRHFNCSDMFYIDVDDAELSNGIDRNRDEFVGAMIFRDDEWIGEVAYPANSFVDKDASGEHEYCVRVIYDGTNILPDQNVYYSMSCSACAQSGPEICEPGAPIRGEYVWNSSDDFGALISWGNQPEPISEWLYYDDDAYTGSIGAGGSVYWGIMIPATQLSAYAGCSLTKVAVFEADQAGEYTLNVYYGGAKPNMGVLVHSQNFETEGLLDWKIVDLTTPLPLDPSMNLWITLYQSGIAYPAMGSTGTGSANGRWVSVDGSEWIDVASAGYNYTWLLRGFVTNEFKGGEVVALDPFKGNAGSTLNATALANVSSNFAFAPRQDNEIVQYNVYRSVDNETYEYIASVDAVAGQGYYEYFDAAATGTNYYQVRAQYENGCESAPALSEVNPANDYVIVNVTGVAENGEVVLYPNPTNGNITIQAENMNRITVVSVLGQVVYDEAVEGSEFRMNMAQFKAGVYMVRIATENGISTQRVTVVK